MQAELKFQKRQEKKTEKRRILNITKALSGKNSSSAFYFCKKEGESYVKVGLVLLSIIPALFILLNLF